LFRRFVLRHAACAAAQRHCCRIQNYEFTAAPLMSAAQYLKLHIWTPVHWHQ
jgi:hypothetical protein